MAIFLMADSTSVTFKIWAPSSFKPHRPQTHNNRISGIELSVKNQLMQLCTARTAWSESDQAVLAMHRCNSRWLGSLWFDSVIKLVSVFFGKCSTLVVTKF